MPSTPVVVLDSTLTDIADAIRGKNGSSDTYKPSEMPAAINAIPSAPAGTIRPTKLVIGGQSGAVEVKPLVTVDVTDSLTSLVGMFANDTGITSVEFDESIDLSNVTSASTMFSNCTNLTSVKLPNDFQTGIDCSSMFAGCRNLRSVVLDASLKPSIASNMFSNCYSLTETPQIDTSGATNVAGLFYGVGSVNPAVPVTRVYDLSSATNINYIFQNYDYGYGSGTGATQSSIDNILQTILTATSYTDTKNWIVIFGPNRTPSTTSSWLSHLANLILNSPYYQDVVDAGWPAIS